MRLIPFDEPGLGPSSHRWDEAGKLCVRTCASRHRCTLRKIAFGGRILISERLFDSTQERDARPLAANQSLRRDFATLIRAFDTFQGRDGPDLTASKSGRPKRTFRFQFRVYLTLLEGCTSALNCEAIVGKSENPKGLPHFHLR